MGVVIMKARNEDIEKKSTKSKRHFGGYFKVVLPSFEIEDTGIFY